MRNRIKTGSSKRQSAVSQKKGYSSDVNAIYNPETKETDNRKQTTNN